MKLLFFAAMLSLGLFTLPWVSLSAEPYAFLEQSGLSFKFSGSLKQVKEQRFYIEDGTGQAHALLEREYSYNSEGTHVTIHTLNEDGQYSMVTVLDSLGNPLREDRLNENGQVVESILSQYDGKGRLIRKHTLYPDGSVSSVIRLRYDSAGILRELTSASDDSSPYLLRMTYEYDYQGRPYREYMDSPQGRPCLIKQRSYDQQGNSVMEVEYDLSGDTTQTTIFTWDNQHRLLEAVTVFAYDIPGRKITYQYDRKGNPLEAQRFSREKVSGKMQDVLRERVQWEYSYWH